MTHMLSYDDPIPVSPLHAIIEKVCEVHPDFTYAEVELFCQSFLATIVGRMKEETKIKRLMKYLEKEFEVELFLGASPSHATPPHPTPPLYSICLRAYLPSTGEGTEQYQLPSPARRRVGDEVNKKQKTIDTLPKYLLQAKPTIASRLIKVTDLSKSIRHTELFSHADLQIHRDDKVALIGKNGSGKTTFLKLLAGLDDDFDGEIESASRLKIGYLTQDLFWQDVTNTLRSEMLQVFPDITERISRLHEIERDPLFREETQAIKEYLDAHDGYRRYDLQLDILGYFWFDTTHLDRPVTQLSWGEQMKVQIAKFIIREVDILILDEPTNHLDIEWIVFLEHFCRLWKKALVFISHDVAFINNTSEKIIEISGMKFHIYTGNYDAYVIEKQKRYDIQSKHYEVQQREIEKQESYINRFRYKASTAASVQSRIKMLDRMEKIDEPTHEAQVKPIVLKTTSHLPEKIFEIRDLTVGYTTPLVTFPPDIVITKHDKIGIIWRNWAGKTTFLKTLLWDIPALHGTISRNTHLTIGSYSQVLSDLNPTSTVMEELSRDHDKTQEIRGMLGGLLIHNEKWHQVISTLSGWERAKVALTKMLLTRPHVIIMDEPTNHLDLHSKNAIQTMLANFNGVSIIVSHDRHLLLHTSTTIWRIQDGEVRIFQEPEMAWISLQ